MNTPTPQNARRLTTTRLVRVAVCLGVTAWCGVTFGCQRTQPLRVTHAPTYSYMHDADARAEVALWPEVTTAAGYDVITVSERE